MTTLQPPRVPYGVKTPHPAPLLFLCVVIAPLREHCRTSTPSLTSCAVSRAGFRGSPWENVASNCCVCTVVPRYPPGIWSRTSPEYPNPRMLEFLSALFHKAWVVEIADTELTDSGADCKDLSPMAQAPDRSAVGRVQGPRGIHFYRLWEGRIRPAWATF